MENPVAESLVPEAHPRVRHDLSIDQRLALKTAATRLESDLSGMFGGIERMRSPASSAATLSNLFV